MFSSPSLSVSLCVYVSLSLPLSHSLSLSPSLIIFFPVFLVRWFFMWIKGPFHFFPQNRFIFGAGVSKIVFSYSVLNVIVWEELLLYLGTLHSKWRARSANCNSPELLCTVVLRIFYSSQKAGGGISLWQQPFHYWRICINDMMVQLLRNTTFSHVPFQCPWANSRTKPFTPKVPYYTCSIILTLYCCLATAILVSCVSWERDK